MCDASPCPASSALKEGWPHFRDSCVPAVPRHVPSLALGIQTHFASSSEDLISKGAGISQKH